MDKSQTPEPSQPEPNDGAAPESQAPKKRLSKGSRASLSVTGLLLLFAIGTSLTPGDDSQLPMAPAGSFPLFDLQGHRGARGLAAENTLAGFKTALGLGVTTLEMDLGLTEDGVLVVSHDRRLNPSITRKADGRWLTEGEATPLIDLKFSDLAALDVGRINPESRYAARFPDQADLGPQKLPPLSEVIDFAEEESQGSIRYNFETKISPEDEAGSAEAKAITQALLALIEEKAIAERSSIQSFDWGSLAIAQEQMPSLLRVHLTASQNWLNNLQPGRPGASPWLSGHDFDDHNGSVPALIAAAGGHVWSPYYRDLRKGDITEAQKLGLKVVVWTVNDEVEMARLIDAGVNGIITDYPDRLRKVIEDKGLALPPSFPRP